MVAVSYDNFYIYDKPYFVASSFRLVGLIIGPFLLAYFYLTVKMFSEEYLSDKE